jgi:carboxylesterase
MNDEIEVIKGAEAFFFEGNDIGVLVSHGFTGSPQSMRYYGKRLHEKGYTVAGPRLAGHGTTPTDMAASTAAQWIESLETALARLKESCRLIFVTGLSMGGTLSLYMAAIHGDTFAGVMPINAAVQLDAPVMAALTFDSAGPDSLPGIGSDIKDPEARELAYEVVPRAILKEAHALTYTTRELLPRVTCPALIFTSCDDHVVPPKNGRLIANLIESDRIEHLRLNNSYHVATLDFDKDFICEKAHEFIQSIAGR